MTNLRRTSVKREQTVSDDETTEEALDSIKVQGSTIKRQRIGNTNTPESINMSSRRSSSEFVPPANNDESGTGKSSVRMNDIPGIWHGRLRPIRSSCFPHWDLEEDSSEEDDETIPYDEDHEETKSVIGIEKKEGPHQELNSALSNLKTNISCLEKAHFRFLWSEQTCSLKSNLNMHLTNGLASIRGELQRDFLDKTGTSHRNTLR